MKFFAFYLFEFCLLYNKVINVSLIDVLSHLYLYDQLTHARLCNKPQSYPS